MDYNAYLRRKYRGKYAIGHRRHVVIPMRQVGGRWMCRPFYAFKDAKAWAVWNYKGNDLWRVIRL